MLRSFRHVHTTFWAATTAGLVGLLGVSFTVGSDQPVRNSPPLTDLVTDRVSADEIQRIAMRLPLILQLTNDGGAPLADAASAMAGDARASATRQANANTQRGPALAGAFSNVATYASALADQSTGSFLERRAAFDRLSDAVKELDLASLYPPASPTSVPGAGHGMDPVAPVVPPARTPSTPKATTTVPAPDPSSGDTPSTTNPTETTLLVDP